tara:strand:- start:353 stop:994 length:642 start_codon:yes stop_codon:yes gene_type:complete
MFNKKQDFIEFTIHEQILKFGKFTLKSGRKSPYFFNTGLCNNGLLLSKLADFYSHYIKENSLKYDFIFGPAYKGITLCSSISHSLYINHSINSPYAFNRKETKNHGDKGNFVGYEIKGNALVVDDVISSGTSIINAIKILEQSYASCKEVLVAFNRMEIGKIKSASSELQTEQGVNVHYLIDLDDVYDYIKSNSKYREYIQSMEEYMSIYKGT